MHHFSSVILLLAWIAAGLEKVPASFEISGASGVTVMHAALLSNGKLAFLDKVEDRNKVFQQNGSAAYCCVYDPDTNDVKPLSAVTNPFCCAGAFLSDGRLVTLGGNGPLELDPNVFDGFDAIRYLDAEGTQNGWDEPGHKLSGKRWYASAQVMPDGTIFVASGSLTGGNQYDPANNNPTYEILDKNGFSQMAKGKSIPMDILVRNQPYYMYPFLHVLKDGSLFVFVNTQAQLFDVAGGQVIKELPALAGMHRTYPSTGGSVMLPLTKHNDWDPEIMICGGGQSDAIISPTDPTCGRINPLASNPQWTMTEMTEGRVMVEGVVLLDGRILWVNGAKIGTQGFGVADDPAYNALIYDPVKDRWYDAEVSTIARLYHSIAIMLRDGRVLITGSNPNEQPLPWPEMMGIAARMMEPDNQYRKFPTEYRNEIWTPPYLMGEKAKQRPTEIKLSARTLKRGAKFQLSFKPVKIDGLHSLDVILYTGGFVTHSLHMGQMMFKMEHTGWALTIDGTMEVHVSVPDVLMAPGPYWIYVIANGVPGLGESVLVEM